MRLPHTNGEFPYNNFDENAYQFVSCYRRHFSADEQSGKRIWLRVLDAMYDMSGIAGAIGWCMSDYNTHKDFGSGDKICYHGVMDMFRLPKEAAAAYLSQQDETPVMEVSSPRFGAQELRLLVEAPDKNADGA